MAMAMRDSVTVSMSEEITGMFSGSKSARVVASWVSRGSTSE